MQQYLTRAEEEMRLRNYSRQTIKSYLGCLTDFFKAKARDFEKMDFEFIRSFLLAKQEKGYSPQTINSHLNAIKFFSPTTMKIVLVNRRSSLLPLALQQKKRARLI